MSENKFLDACRNCKNDIEESLNTLLDGSYFEDYFNAYGQSKILILIYEFRNELHKLLESDML